MNAFKIFLNNYRYIQKINLSRFMNLEKSFTDEFNNNFFNISLYSQKTILPLPIHFPPSTNLSTLFNPTLFLSSLHPNYPTPPLFTHPFALVFFFTTSQTAPFFLPPSFFSHPFHLLLSLLKHLTPYMLTLLTLLFASLHSKDITHLPSFLTLSP